MTRLWLVRHGPTHARAMIGWSDLPADLSDSAAIAGLARALPDRAPIVSSDLVRAVATADALQAQRVRLPHAPDLREMHFGAWEMRSHDEIARSDPEAIRAFWDNPGDSRPPGGESWNSFCTRAHDALDRLVMRHGGGDIIVVAHFGIVLAALQRARGISAREVFGQRIDNLSLTEIALDGGDGWRVGRVNHLAAPVA